MKSLNKKIAVLGTGISLSMILSFVESLIPPVFNYVPGIKMGLANIIIIYILYSLGVKEAFCVSVIRVILVALLFGNSMTFLYSFAGAVLSLTVMYILKKFNLFSLIGVSVAGAVTHNLGQILTASFLLQNAKIGYYMIILAVSGTVSGIIVGLIAAVLIRRFKNIIFRR